MHQFEVSRYAVSMEPTVFTFTEPVTDEECVVIVRRVDGRSVLGLSRKSDGDIEVMLPEVIAASIAEALSV